jgi:anthranilate synthase
MLQDRLASAQTVPQSVHPGLGGLRYRTQGGVFVSRSCAPVDADFALHELIEALDARRGVLLSSGYEYPGRYARWDLGFVDPPIVFSAQARSFEVRALNARGRVLLPAIERVLGQLDALAAFTVVPGEALLGEVKKPTRRFVEEQRSRQPSVFSVLRALRDLMYSSEDPHLGLYGAFGYDLCFQFEPVTLHKERPADARDLVLYLPDNLIVVDRQRERAARFFYEFEVDGHNTQSQRGGGSFEPYRVDPDAKSECDHPEGAYAAAVRRAQEAFKAGDLFELVLSQTFREPCKDAPSSIFRTLQRVNPAPYAFLMNLGQAEYLVGASPEMYVRVQGSRVETCPISGTIARGDSALEDSQRIQELLASKKDESELTMCTDVDRNDKSRICEPGSVKVIGRRQIELYSRLIHTVDHVEGTLRPQFDALDAFLSHTWAVTVTGAPKPAAIARLEAEERSARAWYGGAVGTIGFNGHLNTGLTLRTVRIKSGVAEVRSGATLLYESDPEAEERETRLKASAFLDVVSGRTKSRALAAGPEPLRAAEGLRIVLVDHEDSFVHTIANYLRQLGAEVITLRWDTALEETDALDPDLLLLSPGPGRPRDFGLHGTIGRAIARGTPIFGVCLGLQGLVEYFGGDLDVLAHPMHGKPSQVEHDGSAIYRDISSPFIAGRYHSLYARIATFPACLKVTAQSEDGIVMGIQHKELPIAAVQFHPESILTLTGQSGLKLLNNVVSWLMQHKEQHA